MNVLFTLNEISFEYDDRKDALNIKRRGFGFRAAAEAFFDPFLFYFRSEATDQEERDSVIAMTTQWRLLVVTYTMRGDVIRIVSARDATRAERRQYEDR